MGYSAFPQRWRGWALHALKIGGLLVGLSTTGLAASITSTATVATNTAGWTTWSTATLKSSDNTYADTVNNASATGTLSGFLFSAVPATAGIEGFVVGIEASESLTAVDGYLLTAISSNSGTNYSAYRRSPDSGEFPTSDTAYTEGSSTDTWGISWTVAGATSTLMVKIVGYDAYATLGYGTRVDSVTVTVYYDTAAPSGVTDFSSVQSSTATGQINLSWGAPGDDGSSGNLTGNYRIQYATYTATWSTSSTPTNATTVTIATTSAVPGSAENKAITGLVTQTTYYFVLWSQDNVGFWSGISNTTSKLMDLTAPSSSTIAATAGLGQVSLSWNSAGDNGSSGNLTGNYRIQYASYTATWSTTTTPMNATTVTISTTNIVPGSAQTNIISGLSGGATQYFVLWSQDDGGNWSSVSNTTSALSSSYLDQNQIEVAGLNGVLGMYQYGSNIAFADIMNEGYLDIVTMGDDSSYNPYLQYYDNNGNGTFYPGPYEIAGFTYGQYNGEISCGDFDNDGDIDLLVLGADKANQKQLRVFRKDGYSFTLIDVDGSNGGLTEGGTRWGDFDNDGDLDILAIGAGSTGYQLRVYTNNGNGTINPTQIEVEALNSGLYYGASATWGDFENDGDLDILASGASSGSSYELRVYKNNGNATFNATQIEVDGANGGFILGSALWGDFDSDGDLDILTNGLDFSSKRLLQIYKNNGNGTIDPAQTAIDGANGGLITGGLAWGDFDNDGNLDILASGEDASSRYQLRVYKNNGNGTIDPAQREVDGANGGLYYGGAAWGDFDTDGDLDILVSGNDGSNPQLRIYKNLCTTANTAPTPPNTFSGGFTFNSTSISVASFTWATGTDSGTGATPENVLTYDLQISTTSNFSKLMFPGQMGATPRMGSYLKPAKIYNSNTYYGVMLKSTNPWTAQTTASYGLRADTTYYYRVKTVDAGLAESGWSSSTGTVFAGVSPTTSTLAAASGSGQATLTWKSAGDDWSYNNLTGNYRIQYATYTPTWSTTTTPSDATTVTIATASIAPGANQTKIISGLFRNTTYYFALWTQDDAGNWSGVSNTTSAVPSGESVSPSTSTISATAGLELVTLNWSSAGDDGSTGDLTGIYRVQYATYTASWSTATTPTNATTLSLSTTSMTPGSAQSRTVTSLNGETTYYFVLWSQDEVGNWSGISNTTSAVPTAILWFDPNQIEVEGLNGGFDADAWASWGDFDNDGDLDILVDGKASSMGQLRIYSNNGNGTINSTQIEVDGINNGLAYNSAVAWGDFDNDGDLDILVNGWTGGAARELRVYSNNGNGTIDPVQIEVDGAGGGLCKGGVAWGDFDNDGDIDILESGTNDNVTAQMRVYINNGNGTFDATQIEVDGLNNGLRDSSIAWGDFDIDGDLDIISEGYGGGYQLRVYKNNGNGIIDPTQIEVAGINNGLAGCGVALGDFDVDGDLDVSACGSDGSNYQIRIFRNNGNGTLESSATQVCAINAGLWKGSSSWGDFDNDGDIDILANGMGSPGNQLRVYKNNGNGTFNPSQIEVDGVNGGLNGNSAWGDYDNDGDLDILVLGSNGSGQFRIYTNLNTAPNTTPTPPATLSGGFSFSASVVSIASFTWVGGSDSGTGATLENGLMYDLQISTISNFSTLLFPGQQGASPRMGSYLKPPKIFNSNTYYGVVLKSTNPWATQTTATYGLRTDSTYYYRVKTIDAGLSTSTWSSSGSLVTVVSPSTSTLAATAGSGLATLSWNSAGDDASTGTLTGNYRVQYATYTPTWSTTITPTNATTVTIATTSIAPGANQTKIISGLFRNTTYYFALWTQDDAGNWSGVSNTTSAVPSGESVSPSTSTLAATAGIEQITVSWSSAGDDGATGDLTGIYRVQYATYTASWSTATTPTNATTLSLSTTSMTPGSAQSRTVTGLTSGTTYYFVLWSQDEVGNWSGISNTTSAIPTGSFDPNQIEVDGAGGGVESHQVAWGDLENDGDLDILILGLDATGSQLRVYKNNGNGTFDPAQIEVDSLNGGLQEGRVAWGDFDADGDLDILVTGYGSGSSPQLRVYKNNGNGTIDATQIEVDGLNNGLFGGNASWGDFDNDGDLDILASGTTDDDSGQLRVYKNNGNGTIDAAQIDVDGVGGGVYGNSAWGDFDNDGDLDILGCGWSGAGRQLRVYSNNGNGTIDFAQIEVDGLNNGLSGAVAWGDTDADNDLDIIVSGYDGSLFQMRVYLNNGNGTFDPSQVEVDGTGDGLGGETNWGDFDNDGDLDILISGSDGSNGQLRVYKGNGNGTFDAAQLEVDGLNGGVLTGGGSAWGDFDSDGDIDILTAGTNSGRQLRVYKNLNNTANTTPISPGTLTGTFAFNPSSVSIASFTWSAGSDSGVGATPENVLTYDLQISTTSDFSKLMFPGQLGASPRMGSYLKPPKIFNSNTYYGVVLKSTDPWNAQTYANYGIRKDTTYYYRVKTVDSALAESAWSSMGALFTASPPSTSTLAATAGIEQVTVSWSSAGDDGSTGDLTGIYRVQYATYTASWSTATTPTNATTLSLSTTSMTPDSAQSRTVTGLTSGTTYYFVLWSQDEVGNWSGISNTTSAIPTGFFDPNQIEVDGAGGGLESYTVAWGDLENDGDLDILILGFNGTGGQLRVYSNNGNGTFDPTQIEVDSLNGGLREGSATWGDFDSDGDLDILVSGYDGAGFYPELRIYKNNGNGTIDAAQTEVDGAHNGIYGGNAVWGDFDNDGDLDILASGTTDDTNGQLRVYKNNGNGTFDATQIDVDGVNGGIYGKVAWGDFDADGDLDILGSGVCSDEVQLRVYKNNGNGTFDYTQIEVDGLNNGLSGVVAWGDTDADNDLDIIVSGSDGSAKQLRVYQNNGNGTFNDSQEEVDGTNDGLGSGAINGGDFDNDGDLDILMSGSDGSNGQLRVYKGNGNGTFDAAQIEVDGINGGLTMGGSAWGDFDSDGDIDILTAGTNSGRQLRVYKNLNNTANTTPITPGTLTGTFAFNPSSVSIASFTWSTGSDSGVGATPENVLTYDIQISTTSDFSTLMFPGQQGASPRMGSYLKPPKSFNSNTEYGVLLKSTDPWNTQSLASYGLRTDTTYYYRVKTIDAGLSDSAWSSASSLLTAAPPSTSTLAATASDGEVLLTWASAGDDTMVGNLTGNYRIQYATFSAVWSTSTTPSDVTTLSISTTNVVPSDAQSHRVTSLSSGTEYFFALWSQDDVGAWSGISNTTSAIPSGGVDAVSPSTSTLAGATTSGVGEVLLTWASAGDDAMTGNLTGNYRIQFATYTASWSTASTPSNVTTVTIGTTSVVPGASQSYLASGLTAGLTYYFVLWTGDEVPNWSDISNTTSAVPTSWFDTTQIEVDGAGNGLKQGTVAWGDYDNDGDPDILVNGETGSTRELRIYKNNGNGTINPTQIEVDGAGNGLRYGTVSWGDFDNDGDLDIGALGWLASSRELRVYTNNGNGTINATQLEVDGGGGGMADGSFMWGDYDNDGDIDILAGGVPGGGNSELRIYKNNGNGTTDRSQIEVDGVNGGIQLCGVAWGDYDADGDLDVLAMGLTAAGGKELRIYKNNGNGTIDPAQIEVDGVGNGLQDGGAAWGDFDSDGDLDILASGYTGSTRELRIYKNNGNGTMDAAQIEVDGSGGGLRYSGVGWGDFDNDGDLDVLTNGQQTSGTTRELRVYQNNGNGTMDAAQIEVDGSGNGMQEGGVAWGDYDLDGDLDILTSGEQTSGTTRELRIYKNQSGTANTTPSAPGTLTGVWAYNASGISTATFKWVPGSDTGTGATSANALTYEVEVSSVVGFTGKSVVTGLWSSPGMGNYLNPPKIYDGNTTHGLMLRYLPQTNTTYYFRVKTVDGGLKESAWSATGSVYTLVASSAPSAVTDLAANAVVTDGQMVLTWTAPTNVNSGASSAYDVRYSTVGEINDDTAFSNATALTGEPTPGSAGMSQTMTVTGLVPLSTCYFAIKTSNANGTSALDVSSPRASAVAHAFDATQIEVDGSGSGPGDGSAVWGDFENDGDLDILMSGTVSGSRELRIYKNNANGTISTTQVEVDGATNGLTYSRAIWGDYDNDGDLDILVMGYNGSTRELRIYKNNGNATMDAAQIEVDGSGNGLQEGALGWGDFDNDGDLDILISGYTGSTRELRIYKNNGNGTIDATQIEVDGAGNGFRYSGVAWGDYDNDGDLDILTTGQQTTGSSRELRIYKNNGNGTVDPAQVEVDGAGNGMEGSVAWGDYDSDGDLDILASGYVAGSTRELRIYKNNGNGTVNATQIEVDGSNGGLNVGMVAWGDLDNDGDLDILVNGSSSGNSQLRVYQNNGNGTMDAAQIEVDGLNGGVESGEVHWGDYDSDGDLDVLAGGNSQLRVYKNKHDLKQVNTTPSAPGTLSGSFSFDAGSVSVASLTWNAGTDSGTGSTPENVLTYDIQIATVSNFTPLFFPGQMGASPRMGSYLKPPKIFNSNTYYGVVLKSADPWNAQATASYGLRTDTTYYYRVKTVDSALAESSWSSNGMTYTGVAPSTSTLVATSTVNDGEVLLTWNSAGDDAMNGNVTGTYRIQYATYTPTWSTSSTPTDATTVSISTTNMVPGSAQSKLITGLTGGLTYYFVLWSQDESNNWSGVSNIVSVVPFGWFDPIQINVDGENGGLYQGNVRWGDYDNDGDLDLLATGQGNGGTREIRIYKNNGNGTIDNAQIEVDGPGGGFSAGGAEWGDFDNDGDMDILVCGYTGSSRELRIYKNNGNGTMDGSQIEVDGSNGGLNLGLVKWGDFDNDGDIDVLTGGYTGSTRELRLYVNNGNGTVNPSEMVIDGSNGGMSYAGLGWGDFDNDGDLDILAGGYTSASARELRVYKNNGNGTIDYAEIGVDGPGLGLSNGEVAWGDYDNDGDLDVLASGLSGAPCELRIYKNNGNGTMSATQIEVDGAGNGLKSSSVAWGDYDNDGYLDILTSGESSSNTKELRVYRNNGNGTVNPSQIDVDGPDGGLHYSSVVWGDYDVDGDLDILSNGQTSSGSYELRIYKNAIIASNTPPSAPGTLVGAFSYNPTAVSVASLTWNAGTDSGTGATVENGLTYDLQISTVSDFSPLMFPGQMGASPRMGSYLKPPKIFNGNTDYGVVLKSTDPWNAQATASYGLRTDTTYYYRVKTVDSVLAESSWSSNGMTYTGVVPSTSTLAAASTSTDGEVLLTWNSAGDDAMNGNVTGTYRIQYATYTPTWSTSSTPTDATTVSISTTNMVPGSAQSKLITGLTGGVTYYFVLWTGDEATNWSNISNTTHTIPFSWFDPNQIEVDGAGGGLTDSSVAWGDFDNDGDLDVLSCGQQTSGSTRELRVYRNNGNGTIDASQIEVGGAGNGLNFCNVAWGDFDSDGDLDVIASGTNGTNQQLRIYKNNGNGTLDSSPVEVDGVNGGLKDGNTSWGDFDNDGDLDILANGSENGTNGQLRIYKNNGNGTVDVSQIEVDGLNGGLSLGSSGWGDMDNDGDLDIVVNGQDTAGNRQLRVYKNNGNGTMDPAQIEVDGAGGGLKTGDVAWGDFDNDGDLDILESGYKGTNELWVYMNNGNGTINATEVAVDDAGGGLWYGRLAWGDFDNDGDLDILANGDDIASQHQLRVYKNNGNGTVDTAQIEVDGLNAGGKLGGVAWGDFDNDKDVDILVSGSFTSGRQLRIYKNNSPTANTAPSAPATLTTSFAFTSTSVSTATFKWTSGADTGTGATPTSGLNYDIQLSTNVTFSSLFFPGQKGASPRMGSFLKPPKIFDGNTTHGIVIKSTDPWNTQTTATYGLRTDTTYYYRVKTVDSALEESAWSGTGTMNTGVSPSTSTLTAAPTSGVDEVLLTWTSAGDDAMNGNVTGTYRIQYATYTPTWSTSSTPTDATTVSISTTNMVPGSAQSKLITGLTGGLTYYFVLWTGDEVPNWSSISNSTSAVPTAMIRSCTITDGALQNFGSITLGGMAVGSTGTIILNDGNVANTYAIYAETITVGSPWVVSDSTPAGPDALVIYGVFSETGPTLGDFGPEDVIGSSETGSSGTVFTIDGSTNGTNVPFNDSRPLWIRLDMPTTSRTESTQSVRIRITAQPP